MRRFQELLWIENQFIANTKHSEWSVDYTIQLFSSSASASSTSFCLIWFCIDFFQSIFFASLSFAPVSVCRYEHGYVTTTTIYRISISTNFDKLQSPGKCRLQRVARYTHHWWHWIGWMSNTWEKKSENLSMEIIGNF